MITAAIHQDNAQPTTTTMDGRDTHAALLWAHRMGWNVIDTTPTGARLESDDGRPALLTFQVTDTQQ